MRRLVAAVSPDFAHARPLAAVALPGALDTPCASNDDCGNDGGTTVRFDVSTRKRDLAPPSTDTDDDDGVPALPSSSLSRR